MTLNELVKKIPCKVIAGVRELEREVQGCYICDLLSWVMSRAQKGNVWITVQNNVNIVAVALLTEVACIIIPEDIPVDEQVVRKAEEQGVPLLSSSLNSFELASALKDIL
ncbi:MAG: AraC family transcriptional regulator [Clostridiaceae bacterium]|nr:AraC family transcriptional regulator [Clostridiaceae bacterium]